MLLQKTNGNTMSLEDYFDRFFTDRHLPRYFDGSHTPPMGIVTSENYSLVRMDLPDVQKEDIEITVNEEKYLKIKAERKPHNPAEGEKLVLGEQRTGSFQRIVQLPYRVDSNRTEADLKNGVLTVKIYRAEEDKPRKIEVNG